MRVAPIANRMAISRRLAFERTSCRMATLVHAAHRTAPTITMKSAAKIEKTRCRPGMFVVAA
jgi:hypothetical protein